MARSKRRTDDDMKLPDGETCGNCYWFRRCKGLFGCAETNTTCDWAPSRFLKAARPPTPATKPRP